MLADIGDANLSSEDDGIVVAVHSEFALVNGGVVVSDDGVPYGVGGINEVNVNDVEDLVEDAAASRRSETVLGGQRLSEAVLGLEDFELSLDAVDFGEENIGLEQCVLSGELLEESEEIDDSLLVDVEDVFLLLFKSLVDEDLLDDVFGSPLNVTVVFVDGSVDDGSGNSDVVVLDLSSDLADKLVLLEVQEVDLVVGSGEEGLEFLDSRVVGLSSGSSGDLNLFNHNGGINSVGSSGVSLGGGNGLSDGESDSTYDSNLRVDCSDGVDSFRDSAGRGLDKGNDSINLAGNVVLLVVEFSDDLSRTIAVLAVEVVLASGLA